MITLAAAQPDLRLPRHASDRDTRNVAQDVGDVAGLALLDLLRRDDQRRAGEVLALQRSVTAGDDQNVLGNPITKLGEIIPDTRLGRDILGPSRHTNHKRRRGDAAQQYQIFHGFLPSSATWGPQGNLPSQPNDVAHNESFPRLTNP